MLRPPPRPTLFPYTTLFRSSLGPTPARGATRGVTATHRRRRPARCPARRETLRRSRRRAALRHRRSEEHTSELQSRRDIVCRLLLEKKKQTWSTPAQCPLPT